MAKKARRSSKKEQPPAEIGLIGEIYDELESEVVKDLLSLPEGSEVTFYIDSSGGSVYSALAIVTLVRLKKLKATAVVLSECSSAALLIFAACPKRIVTPRSVFLFHRVKWRSDKDMRREEAVNWAQHFLWLETEVDKYQSALFGGCQTQVSEWIESGRFVLGPELAELGLAEMIDL